MRDDRQIRTDELQADNVWRALRDVLARFEAAGIKEAEVSFGFGWDHKTVEWDYLLLPLNEIEARIRTEEREGQTENQTLGRSDLFLRHPSLSFEIQFCHESDLHIWFDEWVPLAGAIAADWTARGFNPRYWVKENGAWTEQPLPACSTSNDPRAGDGGPSV